MDVNSYLGEIRAIVARHGWAVQVVGPQQGPDGRAKPPFAYTIGVSAIAGVELAVAGMDAPLMGRILGTTAEALRAGRLVLDESIAAAGQRVTGVLSGDTPLLARALPDATPLVVARQVLQADVRAVQLCWPDRGGLFPGDPGVDPHAAADQRIAP